MNKIKPLAAALVLASYGSGSMAQAVLEEVIVTA